MKFSKFKYDFFSPKIIFGRGRINELGQKVLSLLKAGQVNHPKALLVTGTSSLKKSGNLEKIQTILEENNISFEVYNRAGKEPTTDILNEGKNISIEKKCNIIIGAGGGSVMDTAKGIAGLATNEGNVEEYLGGKEFILPSLPFILIPTTSGTGSEVTNNSVIRNKKTGLKKSIRGLWANIALLDPNLTLSLPKNFTAYPGADALVQAIESLVSKSANYISDLYAKQSIKLLGKNLPLVCDDLSNIDLRENMMLGSLMGAISFANGKLGAVHGFAHPIGIKHDIHHGLICGLLLPHVMKFNLKIDTVIEEYAWMARLFHRQEILFNEGNSSRELPNEKKKQAEWAITKIEDIFHYIELPLHLSDVGIKEDNIDDIVKDTTGSSLANNPRNTDKISLKEILLNAL